MCTKFAPMYAILVLGYVMDKLLYPEIAEIHNSEFIYLYKWWNNKRNYW
jgi:hypothetical protein